ncbi:hypothetical protein BVRB_032390 [Beta vulgaris subsp. vulgaris]|uniref:Uncharacterized protein n=1 Tax=Beta vulgaris subsp. vulgaris TaxID=3555 RepID=A0A0J8B0B9_BETVV|nr:hypothetical protein BVRB_032390 [Beta vulgaris subsp. vulgaris]
MASVSDPARGSPPDPRKRPEIGPALTTPRSYYEIVRFCESLDTQEYFESLKITKLKVRVGTRSLDVSPLRLMFDKTIVDVSGLRYMYAAETTRDVLIFAISAHLRLRHIPRDLRFRIKELQYLLDFDVIPAIRCFKGMF